MDKEKQVYDAVIEDEIKNNLMKKVNYSKEVAIEILKSLDIYLTEAGMCDRTDDCCTTSDYGLAMVTSDYYVFHLMICRDCHSIACSVGHISEVCPSSIKQKEYELFHLEE